MATTPKDLTLDEDGNYELSPGHKLPGHTVDALLEQGKVNDARDELERLLMEGIDSGPTLPVDKAFFDELREHARKAALGRM